MEKPMPALGNLTNRRIGYVVKRYPRFSETFIVNEILAHESGGLDVEIFALRPSIDSHFQDSISRVRAPVSYLPSESLKPSTFWDTCRKRSVDFPGLWTAISEAKYASVVDVYQALELAKRIRRQKISHLHAHFATSAATVAQIAARVAGITYSVTMHAKDIFHESVIPEDLASKIAEAEFVVTVSDFNQSYLSNNYGFENKIHRIYNGLDLDLFEYQPCAKPSRKIISVGRLVPKKGFRFLIEACRILALQGVDFECEILGTGELETELRNQIDELALGEFVRLIGPRPQSEVRNLIRSAAVFAAPCIVGEDGNRDGLPTVITESLALGTPCVATDVTGIPEIIRHEETGLIVSQENSQELAAALLRIMDQPELSRQLAHNGRQLIVQEFDINKNVAQIRERFPSVQPRHNSPHFVQPQGVAL